MSAQLHPAAGAFSLIQAALAGGADRLGLRRLAERLRRPALELNETLPVHSAWWRDYGRKPGELLYAAIGDSAAQGIGATRPGRSYVGLLAEFIRSQTGQSVRVANLSVSGATVELAVRDQLPKLAMIQPDIVTVSIGANNIAVWDAAAFARDIRTVFSAVPGDALVADLPCFYLPHNERKVAEANKLLREAAAEHGLTVVPLHDLTRRQGIRGMLTLFAKDAFHPNDHGYQVWADAFLPALKSLVRRRFPAKASAK